MKKLQKNENLFVKTVSKYYAKYELKVMSTRLNNDNVAAYYIAQGHGTYEHFSDKPTIVANTLFLKTAFDEEVVCIALHEVAHAMTKDNAEIRYNQASGNFQMAQDFHGSSFRNQLMKLLNENGFSWFDYCDRIETTFARMRGAL